MAGFLKRRDVRQAYIDAGGSRKEFNQNYRDLKSSLRKSGMSERDARNAAIAAIYDQSQMDTQDFTDSSELENIQSTNPAIDISRAKLNGWQNRIIQPATISSIASTASPTISSTPTMQSGPNYDSMSFADAFATARKLHGPDGTFTWKGKLYGTKYADEVKKFPAQTSVIKPTDMPTTNDYATNVTYWASLPGRAR